MRFLIHGRGHQGQRWSRIASELGHESVFGKEKPSGYIPDGIIVATPPHSHVGFTMDALMAGIPVLCEKPSADELTATQAMVLCSMCHGVPLLVGHQHLFSERFLDLLSRAPKSATITWGGPSRFKRDWDHHAWSMAWALSRVGAEISVSTGTWQERVTSVETDRGSYDGSDMSALHNELRAFVEIMRGARDWRADPMATLGIAAMSESWGK